MKLRFTLYVTNLCNTQNIKLVSYKPNKLIVVFFGVTGFTYLNIMKQTSTDIMAAKSKMNLIEKAGGVLRTPSAFFKAAKAEKGFKDAFVYLAVISLVSSILNYFLNPLSSSAFTMFGGGLGFGFIIAMWVVGLVLSFVIYGFFHLFVMLLGGKKGYHNTYKAFAYSSTPTALLGWVSGVLVSSGMGGMIIGALVLVALLVWAFYINLRGLSILQEMTMWRTLAVMVIGVAVIVVIIVVTALLAGLFVLSFLSTTGIP